MQDGSNTVNHASESTQGRACFVVIPGAGGMASYWHRVAPLLEAARHEVIAVDLPGDDPRAGLNEYADIVLRAIGARVSVILVAHSLAGFTVPLVLERAAVRSLIFVNAMIPLPGEMAGAWWDNTQAVAARLAAARTGGYDTQFSVPTYFLHDVPDSVLRDGPAPREQADTVFGEPCQFARWPVMPIRVIAAANDRFFPLDFQARVARERLNTNVESVPGGHLVALSNPQGLADRLLQQPGEGQ
jgi:pimeloyl-ACP methyl ester carboxylesterase